MKLYCTTYWDSARTGPQGLEVVGHCQQWYGTQAQQAVGKKQLKTDGMEEIQTHAVDVPTDKPGLLAWLNEHEARP